MTLKNKLQNLSIISNYWTEFYPDTRWQSRIK